MIKELNYLRRFKSYYGLKGAEAKLRKWLHDFQFMDVRTADKMVDWASAAVINL